MPQTKTTDAAQILRRRIRKLTTRLDEARLLLKVIEAEEGPADEQVQQAEEATPATVPTPTPTPASTYRIATTPTPSVNGQACNCQKRPADPERHRTQGKVASKKVSCFGTYVDWMERARDLAKALDGSGAMTVLELFCRVHEEWNLTTSTPIQMTLTRYSKYHPYLYFGNRGPRWELTDQGRKVLLGTA